MLVERMLSNRDLEISLQHLAINRTKTLKLLKDAGELIRMSVHIDSYLYLKAESMKLVTLNVPITVGLLQARMVLALKFHK